MAHEITIGEVVEGRYKILRPIAEGGMGTVYLAEHWLIKRRVAIKILHAEYATDADMLRRFMNEALAAGTLGHPNIVESTDMGFTRTQVPYIVFEYLQGKMLSNEIDRVRRIPVARALKIAIQIASALGAAHDAGIIHRDLKADNVILIEKAGVADHVKVLDFGISRFVTALDRTAVGGMLIGTPEAMAPEQMTSPDTIDRRADIYALGVMMYEMLAGHLPFHREPSLAASRGEIDIEVVHALMTRIINDPPPPLKCSDAPDGLLQMIVDKLLAKDPNKRFQTMSAVAETLEGFASMLPQPVMPTRAKTDRPRAEVDELSDHTVSRIKLEPAELVREVQQLGKRWKLEDDDLHLDLYSRKMTRLASAIESVAAIADEMEHHPKIAVTIPHLRLTIPKVSTVVDLVFAARIEQWLRDHGW